MANGYRDEARLPERTIVETSDAMRTLTPPTQRLLVDRRLLAFGFVMMFWSSPGQTYLISLFGAHIREAFDLSHSDWGGLYSLGTLLSAAAMVVTGRFVDRFDLRALSAVLAIALGVACFVMSSVVGVLSLGVAFFLLRQVGQGLMSHTASITMSRYFEGVRGRASAVAAFGFAAAEAILPALTIALIAALGWRGAWRVTAIATLLILLPTLWWILARHGERHRQYLDELQELEDKAVPGSRRRQWTRGEVLRDKRFYLVMPAALAPSFFFTGLFFHQVHVVAAKGWSLAWWGAWFGLHAGASLLSMIVTGPLVDRVGAVRLMPYFALPLALGLFGLSLSDAKVAGLSLLFLAGVTSGWTVTVMGPFWAELYGVKHLGSIKALGSALSVFASALSPFLLGKLLDAGMAIDQLSLRASLYILAACTLALFAFKGGSVRPLNRKT